MKLESKAYTPSSIGNLTFRIPLYQRPYAWTDIEVNQFLEDICESYLKDKTMPYYIGIMSVAKTQTDSFCYDLIDGQQRITTLILMGNVLKKFDNRWVSFLNGRLDLYGRLEDKKYLQNFDESSDANPNIKNAVAIMRSFIETDERIKDRAVEFAGYVFEKLCFFLSEVPDGYTLLDKNKQFVRMNNRGRQLEKHEILKVRIQSMLREESAEFAINWDEMSQMGCSLSELRRLCGNNVAEQTGTGKTIKEIITQADKIEPIRESEIFYSSLIGFPEFLLIALSLFVNESGEIAHSDFKTDNLLEIFYNKINTKNVQRFYYHLKRVCDCYIINFVRRDKDENYKFIGNVADDSERRELILAQSYLYVSTQPTYRWILPAMRYLNVKDDEKWLSHNGTARPFIAELEKIDKELHGNISEYKLDNGSGTNHYVFYRLDYELWKRRNSVFSNLQMPDFDKEKLKNLVDGFVFRRRNSVEHISPRNPEHGSAKSQCLNSFGNLALISVGSNSGYSNKSFSEKRGRFLDALRRGHIESLKLLHAYSNSTNEWTEDDISRHGNEMKNILAQSTKETINSHA